MVTYRTKLFVCKYVCMVCMCMFFLVYLLLLFVFVGVVVVVCVCVFLSLVGFFCCCWGFFVGFLLGRFGFGLFIIF